MAVDGICVPFNAVTKIGEGPVLVLAPHPDDEVFGCGGSIIKHVKNKENVYVVIVTDGSKASDTEQNIEEYIQLRQQESIQAAQILGYGKPTFWNIPDQGIVFEEELIQKIVNYIEKRQIKIVYTPSIWEIHPDHSNLGMMTIEAIRRLKKDIFLAMYEVGSPLRPNLLLDISDVVQKKHEAMKCFASQLELQDYITHIESLNRFRTYNLPNNTIAAEAYFLESSDQLKKDPLSLYFYERQYINNIGKDFNLKQNPLVSVIVRTIGQPLLENALHSIEIQTYPNIEIVLVNASGDQKLNNNLCFSRFPVKICSEDIPLPRSKAANIGLKNARGEFINFLDEDDIFYPDHIEKLVRALQKQPTKKVAYSGCRIEFLDHDESLISDDELNEPFEPKRLQVENFIPNHAVLFSCSLLKNNCKFDEKLDRYEDWDFLLQLSRYTDFIHEPIVTACYRNYGKSGFGYVPDSSLIEKNRSIFFDKWRKIWSGKELNSIMEYMKYNSPWITKIKNEISSIQADLDLKNEELKEKENQIQQLKKHIDYEVEKKEIIIKKLKDRIADKNNDIKQLQHQIKHTELVVQDKDNQIAEILNSNSWKITGPLRWSKSKIINVRNFSTATKRIIHERGGGIKGSFALAKTIFTVFKNQGLKEVLSRTYFHLRVNNNNHKTLSLQSPARFRKSKKVIPHSCSVDIIVCVHNALEDTKKCLNSIVEQTSSPYNLILIDDGSNESTKKYLQEFTSSQGACLHRNDSALGYTYAANQGLKLSKSDYVILLNSDTLVTPEWLDRMIMCAESDSRIGLVGPLSNKASWQSIPDYESDGDWADNVLPEDIGVQEMARLVAQYSGRFYPDIPFLNGFCLMIKRRLLNDLGYFDEKNFGSGYGEENDYCLRAGIKGWKLALADDVYIYHAHSKSYSDERRKQLYHNAESSLEKKHDLKLIHNGVRFCRQDRVLESIRARSRHIISRRNLLLEGRKQWAGKSVLFILPVTDAGGGSNIIINEATALMNMGIDVHILNFEVYKQDFLTAYPDLDIPVSYLNSKQDIPQFCKDFDAVIATFNPTVYWIASLTKEKQNNPILGYYIQDFEPYFYPKNSNEYQQAFQSYSYIPNMIKFCKTAWNQEVIRSKTNQECSIVGPSFNVELFRPEPRKEKSWPDRSLRIVAMIRPSSPRRSPKQTMQVLGNIKKKLGDQVELILFGENDQDPQFKALPNKFEYRNLGKQNPEQLAYIFNESDIFVDFSTYQAMGLTGLEAMGCGLAVILPKTGGVHSYAQNDKNALLVDTKDINECQKKLEQLIKDEHLRSRLQAQAIGDSAQFYPESAAFKIMEALFSK